MQKYIFLVIIFIFITIVSRPSRADIHKLTAVSSLVGFEEFYIRKKNEAPQTYIDDGHLGQLEEIDYSAPTKDSLQKVMTFREPPYVSKEYDLLAKSRICAYVCDSGFFDMREEDCVNLELNSTELELELRKNYEGIYQDIYGDWLRPALVFLNPYSKRTVTIGSEEYREYVFLCLVRKRGSEEIVSYFLSPLYDWYSPHNPHLTLGRFLFAYNERKELEVVALAEESATYDRLVINNTHMAYYHARSAEHSELDFTSNPACTMSMQEKIRLCAIVLTSDKFRDEIKFWPTSHNVDSECDKKTILAQIRIKQFDTEEDIDIIYDEWVMGCKAKRIDADVNEQPQTFLISRGLEPNSIIVFEPFAEGLYSPYVGLTGVGLISLSGRFRLVSVDESDYDSVGSDWYVNLV